MEFNWRATRFESEVTVGGTDYTVTVSRMEPGLWMTSISIGRVTVFFREASTAADAKANAAAALKGLSA